MIRIQSSRLRALTQTMMEKGQRAKWSDLPNQESLQILTGERITSARKVGEGPSVNSHTESAFRWKQLHVSSSKDWMVQTPGSPLQPRKEES